MNNYRVTKCPCCGEVFPVNEEITVHGAQNLNDAIDMIKKSNIQEAAKNFCWYCGGKLPCGCDNPSPQGGYAPV